MSYQEEMLKEIADAIREVEGTEDKIPANQFASRVAGLSVVKPSGSSDIPEKDKSMIVVYATNSIGGLMKNAPVTITNGILTFNGNTDNNGKFSQQVEVGTYIVTMGNVDNNLTPESQSVVAEINEANYVYMVYSATTITVNAKKDDGSVVIGASVTITSTSDSSIVYAGTTNESGVFSKAVAMGEYTIVMSGIDGEYYTPATQTITTTLGQDTIVTMTYNKIKTALKIYAMDNSGGAIVGALVSITGDGTYSGVTGDGGLFYQEVVAGTYTISVNDKSGYTTPTSQTVSVVYGQELEVDMVYVSASITYGVKIDLNDSNPETSVTYTDGASNFTKSYMDFENGNFVWGSWQDKFPFNEIKPCYMVKGVVTKYLNPNNYAEDIDGNTVNITSSGTGDVMIEIPKIYYKLHKDSNYQYIQISNTAQDGFCCLAHTYKGVEKDKIYVGAYQSYYDGTKLRSVSGISATGEITIGKCRQYAQKQGNGYEQFYWNLSNLLKSLFVIQFKSLDSKTAMGYGLCKTENYSIGGTLNTNGMNYCASGTSPAQMKWLGIEDFYGSRMYWVDGVTTSGSGNNISLKVTNVTNTSMMFENNDKTVATNLSEVSAGKFFTKIVGENETGFAPQGDTGSSSTYYCTSSIFKGGYVAIYGSGRTSSDGGGAYGTQFVYSTTTAVDPFTGRLCYCG